MNARERFNEVMEFNPSVRTLKYEYAFWGGTLNRWYKEGLPQKHFIELPKAITTPTSSLYLAAYSRNRDKIENEKVIPDGLALFGGGVYWPTQGLPKERDAEDYFGFDPGIRLIDINQLFFPMFDPVAISEDENDFVYIDIDGIKRIYQKSESTMPTSIEWIIKDRDSWERVKEERLNLKQLEKRFPENWSELVKEFRNRNYPLTLGGYPHGFFGLPAHLLGYENLFYLYYDDPGLVHDILDTFITLWLSLWEVVTSEVEVDMIQIFEDVSMGTGSMVSSDVFKEFMMPYYQRVADFAKAKGIKHIFVDTDGNCEKLIPLFLESGVNGLYPMEASAGMDVQKVRINYPRLKMFGGISKYAVANGGEELVENLEKVKDLLRFGGYIPFVDHSVPALVSWEGFKNYRLQLNEIIDAFEK